MEEKNDKLKFKKLIQNKTILSDNLYVEEANTSIIQEYLRLSKSESETLICK